MDPTTITTDPTAISWMRIVLAFVVVFGLLALLGYVLKHINTRGIRWPGLARNDKRLEIVESLAVDARRRVVIVRCDDDEHLILLGPTQDIVVKADIPSSNVLEMRGEQRMNRI